jgi:hypothetical protein
MLRKPPGVNGEAKILFAEAFKQSHCRRLFTGHLGLEARAG